METAKVDIRKLQVLNDRITQTLDALNQVRLSVHGLSHSSANPGVGFGAGFNPLSAYGAYGQQQIPGVQGQIPSLMGYGQSPFAQQQQFGAWGAQQPFGFPQGFSHTSGVPTSVNPYLGYGQSFGQQGIGQQAFGQQTLGQIPGVLGQGMNPLATMLGINPLLGLSHTSGSEWADPTIGVRVAQTFPNVFSPYQFPQGGIY